MTYRDEKLLYLYLVIDHRQQLHAATYELSHIDPKSYRTHHINLFICHLKHLDIAPYVL